MEMDQGMITIIFMVLIFGVMYLFMIRPQQKREKAMREMIRKLQVGDLVVTNGGIVGKVVEIKDDDIVMETSIQRTKIELKKAAIQNVEPAEAGDGAKEDTKSTPESKDEDTSKDKD